jgi:hypothetical protein
MDDSDLAGPVLFFFLFGFFLLFVGSTRSICPPHLLTNSIVWQTSLRLHLWSGPPRHHLLASHPLTHVATAITARNCRITFISPRTPWHVRLLTSLQHAHLSPICLSIGILPTPISAHIVSWRSNAHGYGARLRSDYRSNNMVYLQQLGHVLCGR